MPTPSSSLHHPLTSTSTPQMDAIVSYMKSRNLPRELQMRIRRYYKHYLEKKTAFDEGSILSELSTFLRQEVAMFLVNDTLYKIPLFERVGKTAPSYTRLAHLLTHSSSPPPPQVRALLPTC